MTQNEVATIQNIIYDINKAMMAMEMEYERDGKLGSLTAYSIIAGIREKLLQL